MTLWERIEWWRSGYGRDRNGYHVFSMNCAAELETDLRELRAVVERVPCSSVSQRTKGVPGHAADCPRCALEARIGKEKP